LVGRGADPWGRGQIPGGRGQIPGWRVLQILLVGGVLSAPPYPISDQKYSNLERRDTKHVIPINWQNKEFSTGKPVCI